MLSKYQNQQLVRLLDTGMEVEEVLNILVEKDIISNEQANEVYKELR